MWLDDDTIINKLENRYRVYVVKCNEYEYLKEDIVNRRNYLFDMIEEILVDSKCSKRIKNYCETLKMELERGD